MRRPDWGWSSIHKVPVIFFALMKTVEEIEAAIRLLSPTDREKLVKDLPTLLPELHGDAVWERIIQDNHSRPALTALMDQIESKYRNDPETFSEIQESDFDRHS